MKQKKLHAYQTLLRMAQVRELRASMALSEASGEESACRSRLDAVKANRDAICAADRNDPRNGQVDIGRYEMLSLLDAAFAERQQLASDNLAGAIEVREERANSNLLAKRYRERISEHVVQLDQALHHEHAAKVQEDAIELWLGGRGEP